MLVRLSSIVFAVAMTAMAVPMMGCGASTPTDPNLAPSGLPMWSGHATELFDDNIDPAAVGMSMEGPSPRSDRFLRERAQTAELVARVRVDTVTVGTVGDETSYHLGVQVGTPTFAKPKLKEQSLELVLKPSSRGYPIAKAVDTRLRGKTFVAFVSRFANKDGDLEYHFHLSADTADVANAVKEATALGELSGS